MDRPDNRLAEFQLGTTEEIETTADDSVKLLARLVKPAAFDSSKKYPVVVFVYGGPHSQVVRDQWGATSLFDQLLVSRGYVVWSLDTRGSSGRGHAWETAILRETVRHELADQNAPGVWKCGVAAAPVTDWKFYDTIYTELTCERPRKTRRDTLRPPR